MGLPRIGLGLTLAITVATATSLPANAQDATPAGTPAGGTPAAGSSALEITSQEIFGSDDGEALSLSPDGRWVALARPAASSLESADDVCAYPIVTREAPTCIAFTGEAIAADSVAWSPDSTRFAFTEDLPRRLIDSDIWVFDRPEATLVNLTDDGVSGELFEPSGSPLLDLAPAWSPDGEQIAFSRTADPALVASGSPATTIQRISADGGEPAEVASVSDQQFAVFTGIHWREGDTILYSVAQPDPDSNDGLWTVSADNGEPEQLVQTAELDLDVAILVDVSVGGMGLLKTSGASLDEGNPVGFAIVDLVTGDTQPVTLDADGPVDLSGQDAGPILPSVLAAGFSPDGGTLLLAGSLAGDLPVLIVRDLESGEDRSVGVLDQPVGAADYRNGIDWGENGFVLIPAGQNMSLLLTIENAE